MAKAKTDTKTKTKKTQPAAAESFGPRVDVFDAKGKPKTVDASALRIAFADGRSLIISVPDTADGAITLVAEHSDTNTNAMLSLRPEHHDSVTLRIEAEPVQTERTEDLDDTFWNHGGEAFDDAEMLTLDLTVQHGDELKAAARKALPKEKDIEAWIAPALFADAQLNVRFVGEEEGRTLNRTYRDKDYATNVLTFSYAESDEDPVAADIVLCCPVVEKEAKEQGKPLVAHYAHLIVHGALHAQGYDHEDPADAEEMEGIETEILGDLGFADPYASR
ncbi:rRNA maturation RNase YbeY [Ralstonia insidiosa]|uniref:rRNA maturation RNase YbeY n=1 Tax=Ralstonia TaxID=48736 RepID=UPI0006649C74|nr:rRNA maturation RNase YbeY [Ralstonia insidiosa]KMW46506.1 metalloprotease [Ralstonia sp. MD27]MBX3771787.1 rRNA maturation RNase YbeY [Ralstonia pickettii]NOZ16711.1 rRNA maturation RNase YbeY [Betaproteobacteria bacterium]MBA9855886.1 rRNA maturation RNase YbeY [Ralstonia insidiosa]MBA9868829.1 rRNA maturation RNase YbeY [Ralstonia insidiosa]